jgi:sigma-B regulation protein RsbU (phosphoserine phosphatase)
MASPSSTTGSTLGRRLLRVLVSAGTTQDAVRGVLREVIEAFGWSLGVLWLLDETTGLLRWGGDWAGDDGVEELVRVCRRLTFAPGVGLPGSVFASLQPDWVEDLADALPSDAGEEFPRADVVLRAGMRGVVDVPVVGRDGPVGVLECFGRVAQRPSPPQLEALGVAGHQLAEYMTRTRIEDRLRSTEESSASIVRAALDCIITMDHRGRVLDFNPAAEATFGYERDAVIGELLADLIIPSELRDLHHRALARYVERGEATILNRRLELTGMRADETTFPAELTVTRVGTSEPPVFAGFIRDITERRDAEEQLGRLLDSEHEERVRAEHAEQAARRAAAALQRSLLPPLLPSIPGVELGAAYRSGTQGWDVGGDFYDVFELSSGNWALVVGDVCGKGLEAAAMTAMVRYAVRAAAVRHGPPSDVLRAVNDALLRDTSRGEFCTAIYACMDVSEDVPVVRLAVGGHPLPLLLDASGTVTPVGRAGTLLGAFPGAVGHDDELLLRPGELMLFYTDGVTEARTPHGMFGLDRLAALLAGCVGASAQEVAERVQSAVSAATDTQVADDLAVLALRAAD